MSTSYIIRTCNSDFTSHNGFRWPALGEVVCPDFDAAKECGAEKKLKRILSTDATRVF